MIAYSIKDIEALTGIKAHTLRIWEKRYGIIQPKRTESNIRYFSERDVENILHISLLNKKGYKISKIVKMTPIEIIKQVAKHSDVSEDFEHEIDSLMMAIFELDSDKFNLILDNQVEYRGFEYVMEIIIYPLLDKLNTMWMAGSVKSIHETFVTNSIRRKLIHKIENTTQKEYKAGFKFIVFLPQGDTHELSILFTEYILSKNNIKVINLGINVSLIEVLEAMLIYKPTHIFTVFNDSFSEISLQAYLDEFAKNLGTCQLLISGFQIQSQNIQVQESVQIISGLKHFKSYLSIT